MEDRITCQAGDASLALVDNHNSVFSVSRLALNIPLSPVFNRVINPVDFRQATTQQQDRDRCFVSLEGRSRQVKRVKELVDKVARTNASVMILGESGTGKEVAAREIHRRSLRRDKPFVPINCGAIPADLLESELFGHEKGSFTGALSARAGRFELAEGGTLFLDEIGDMTLDMQVKLLRVLQEHTFERVGSNKTRVADVRIIAATHRNLEERILDNKFREDLYYRLNVFPIEMPSLRDRIEDIPSLLESILSRLQQERSVARFSNNAIRALQNYSWPGNVRELSNLIERMCIMNPGETIDVSHLPDRIFGMRESKGSSTPRVSTESTQELNVSPLELIEQLGISRDGIDLKEFLTRLELHYIKLALDQSGGVVARAAKLLKLGRTTLVEKLRKYDIDRAA
jgi:sigma-54 specific flagellar transcriptional regulator A